jgi:RNA polymerase sigma-54 factor
MSHLSTHLGVKASLKPVVTAQVQLAIDLLQANRAQLRQVIEQMAQTNPLLDVEAQISAIGTGTLDFMTREPEMLDFSKDHFEWIDEINEDFHHHFDETYSPLEIKSDKVWDDKRDDPLQHHAHEAQGQQWLKNQLVELCDQEPLRELALWLASCTDSQGLLEKPLSELSEESGHSLKLLEEAKQLLQQLEPLGFGSESLQEALKIQLEAKGHGSCLCHQMVCNHWQELTHRKWQSLAKKMHTSIETIEYEVRHHLKGLHTHFELEDFSSFENTVSLDMTIEFEQGKPVVKLLDIPSAWIKIQTAYLSDSHDKEVQSYLNKKKMECLWLMKALMQREKNLVLVTSSIAHWQKEYLTAQGPLKPLVLKDIAQFCQLHESTVARACQDKLAQTPIGVLSLKSLFCSKVTSGQGKAHSSEAICEKIKLWISQEDPHHPLRDEEIVARLKLEGMDCARRTVAKYRDKLGLVSSQLRKMP